MHKSGKSHSAIFTKCTHCLFRILKQNTFAIFARLTKAYQTVKVFLYLGVNILFQVINALFSKCKVSTFY